MRAFLRARGQEADLYTKDLGSLGAGPALAVQLGAGTEATSPQTTWVGGGGMYQTSIIYKFV